MLEVEVRNFQSIEKATFQVDGFTVVVGRSNIGKSALVRAIKAALTGASVSSFVRHGAGCLRRTKQAKSCKCFASVHLRGEQFDLLWEKGDAINRYTFNGVVYDKAERGTPDFLQPDFAPVKVGDRSDLLQVADQFSPIFLLDQTGGAVADTLSDVARLDRINAAMRLAERDRKEAVSTRKVREKDVSDLRLRLTSYDGLDVILAEAQALERRQVDILKQERTIQTVDGYMVRVAASASVIRELSAVATITIPDSRALVEAKKDLDRAVDYTGKYEDRVKGVAALSGLEDVTVPSIEGVRAQADLFDRLDGWVATLTDMKTWLVPWKAVESCTVPSPKTLVATSARLSEVDKMLAQLEGLTASIASLQSDLDATLGEEAVVNKERDELGVCPTCIRPISECGGVK